VAAVWWGLVVLLLSASAIAGQGGAAQHVAGQGGAATEPCPPEEACPIDLGLDQGAGAADAAGEAPSAQGTLLFFWGVGCPHCEQAKPLLEDLAREHAELEIELIEVRQDEAGRERFMATVERLEIAAPGVPTFVYGDRYMVGYMPGSSEAQLRALIAGDATSARAQSSPEAVTLPLVGVVDPTRLSLPAFTLLVGLVDGINPCAMWVLLVLLGILTHVKSRKRLLLFGGAFVVMSGVVYFLFMTVWVSLFSLMGLSRVITIGLGAVVLAMGLINLKELIWFKKGVSLVIPDKVKPKIYKRMRAITRAASLPAAFVGVVALAFFVNLVELGCTLGLPAVYTRVLTLRAELGTVARYLYLALYNVAYIVPLAIIVIVYALTLHRMTLGERGAKILKGVSGVLLVTFGLVLILAPELLSTT